MSKFKTSMFVSTKLKNTKQKPVTLVVLDLALTNINQTLVVLDLALMNINQILSFASYFTVYTHKKDTVKALDKAG